MRPGLLTGTLLTAALLLIPLFPSAARAQQLDLSHGGPIGITARDGIEWRQAEREVIAAGDARAVRDNVTVTADRLIAWYRKKGEASGGQPGATHPPDAAPAAAPGQSGLAGDTDTGGNEIYRVQAEGNVHIFTQTDKAQGDRAVYDLDQSVLVMTGHDLKLTTPNDVVTARDTLEYWAQKHMAVARGDAVVVTSDARRIAADTLVAYTSESQAPQPGATLPGATPGIPPVATPVAAKTTAPNGTEDPLAASGKLERVEAFGHVSVRTQTDTVTGDRAVYVQETGIARVGGTVRITRGDNQLNGAEADVNMKTGIARLIAGAGGGRVQGLVVPNDETNKALSTPPQSGSAKSGSAQTGASPGGSLQPAPATGGRK
jgi:lipopolysaccharide export system protein LptA